MAPDTSSAYFPEGRLASSVRHCRFNCFDRQRLYLADVGQRRLGGNYEHYRFANKRANTAVTTTANKTAVVIDISAPHCIKEYLRVR